jgi:hypothetical protein
MKKHSSGIVWLLVGTDADEGKRQVFTLKLGGCRACSGNLLLGEQ